MRRVRSLILSLVFLSLPGLALAQSAIPWSDDFNGSTPVEYVDSVGCDHVSYGGLSDSGSLLLLGGGLCWLGPFSAVPAGHVVQLAYTAISSGSAGAGSYRWVVVRASDSQSVAFGPTRDEAYYQTTGYNFYPGSQDVSSFYLVAEHISGVSFYFDNVTVSSVQFAANTPTPVPTNTPVPPTATVAATATAAATNTPVPTNTPIPTPTPVPTNTPIPWDEWIFPQDDLFDPLTDLRESVTGKEPFYTLQRFYEQRETLSRGLARGPIADDLSAYPSQAQAFFWSLIGFLSPLLVYIQILFDAFVVVMFWQYVTRRITT